jgi:thiol:disulfide interchange protein DsbC
MIKTDLNQYKPWRAERRRALVRGLSAALLLAGVATVLAWFVLPRGSDTQQIKQRLQALFPATPIDAVRTTPLPGLFEVQIGTEIAYADATGRHFLFGHLVDMVKEKDLTASVKQRLTRMNWADLPLHNAFTKVQGKGTRRLAIFSDPDCPYCKQLEAELDKVADVTIHTFVVPMLGTTEEARARVNAVWCSPNRAQAWQSLVVDGKPPALGMACETPFQANLDFVASKGLQGTPTILAESGRVIRGFANSTQLENLLSMKEEP